MKPTFFKSPSEFRTWLEKHHNTARELVVGFHRKNTGRPTITWPESVAEALCFGWIDGIRRRIDGERYTIRFTPRRPGSAWSAVNIQMVLELEAAGRMTPAGRAAFERRRQGEPAGYSYERRGGASGAHGAPARERRGAQGSPQATEPGCGAEPHAGFDEKRLKAFMRNRAAWAFFEAQPPGYRRMMTWWVMSAKGEDTRDRRLARLVASSAAGKRVI